MTDTEGNEFDEEIGIGTDLGTGPVEGSANLTSSGEPTVEGSRPNGGNTETATPAGKAKKSPLSMGPSVGTTIAGRTGEFRRRAKSSDETNTNQNAYLPTEEKRADERDGKE